MPAEYCFLCETEIHFRTINGRPTPLHPTGSQCPGKKFYRHEERDICHPTSCPHCQSAVYFIRHNGGCAWFDDLGAPWEKHPCFAEQSQPPKSWTGLAGKEWRLVYLQLLGSLIDGSGGVFCIRRSAPNRRESVRREKQYKLQQNECHRDDIIKLDGKTVLQNKGLNLIKGPDEQTWRVSKHTPSYA